MGVPTSVLRGGGRDAEINNTDPSQIHHEPEDHRETHNAQAGRPSAPLPWEKRSRVPGVSSSQARPLPLRVVLLSLSQRKGAGGSTASPAAAAGMGPEVPPAATQDIG